MGAQARVQVDNPIENVQQEEIKEMGQSHEQHVQKEKQQEEKMDVSQETRNRSNSTPLPVNVSNDVNQQEEIKETAQLDTPHNRNRSTSLPENLKDSVKQIVGNGGLSQIKQFGEAKDSTRPPLTENNKPQHKSPVVGS